MDAERQPLLARSRFRALSYEEVARYRGAVGWRRARVAVVVALWATLAAAAALAAGALLSPAPCTPPPPHAPTVPLAHLSLAPLVAAVQEHNQKQYML